MKSIVLPMTALPSLTLSIKQVIGLSLWDLMQVRCGNPDVKFLLKTTDQSFLLDEEGNILKAVDSEDSIDEIARVFFEGYVIPSDVKINSISNSVCV